VGLSEHIYLGKIIKIIFRNFHNQDIEYAKYRIGQSVTTYPRTQSLELNSAYYGRQDRVIGINSVQDGVIEYCVEKYPYLLFEEEVEPLLLSPP
jgi:hypothetical protein